MHGGQVQLADVREGLDEVQPATVLFSVLSLIAAGGTTRGEQLLAQVEFDGCDWNTGLPTQFRDAH